MKNLRSKTKSGRGTNGEAFVEQEPTEGTQAQVCVGAGALISVDQSILICKREMQNADKGSVFGPPLRY